jgi:hypothetical protein
MAAIQHLMDFRRLRAEAGNAIAEAKALGNAALHRTDVPHPPVPEPLGTPGSSYQVLTRMGFGVDVVGYSRRPAPDQVAVQQRLAALTYGIIEDLGVAIRDTDRQPSGDGIHVFLPPDVELHRALPILMAAAASRLAADNTTFADRMRIRMAAVFGPVGLTALGFGGRTIITCGRLVDSSVIREAIVRHPAADLVVLVADALYRYVVGEGYPGLTANQFRRKRVRVKEFDEPAWLWVAPTNYHSASLASGERTA